MIPMSFVGAVGPNSMTFIDPAVAIGYDYAIGAGDPDFASVLLPSVGDNHYTLHYFSGGNAFDIADWRRMLNLNEE